MRVMSYLSLDIDYFKYNTTAREASLLFSRSGARSIMNAGPMNALKKKYYQYMIPWRPQQTLFIDLDYHPCHDPIPTDIDLVLAWCDNKLFDKRSREIVLMKGSVAFNSTQLCVQPASTINRSCHSLYLSFSLFFYNLYIFYKQDVSWGRERKWAQWRSCYFNCFT